MRYLILITLFFTTMLPFNQAQANTDIHKDILYKSGSDHPLHKLDIYAPSQNNETTPRPVVIHVHGGGWHIGDKTIPSASNKLYEGFTNEGVILVTINYRLSPEVKHPSHVQDVAEAIKWVHNNIGSYAGDRTNMVLTGHGAGAHLAALIGTDERYLNHHLLTPAMFKSIMPVDTANYNLVPPSTGLLRELLSEWKMAAMGTTAAELMAASPHHNIKPASDKIHFQIYANKEREESITQSVNFTKALKKAGHDAVFHMVDRGLTQGEMGNQIFEVDGQTYQDILWILKNPTRS